jgi:hypothetical protein
MVRSQRGAPGWLWYMTGRSARVCGLGTVTGSEWAWVGQTVELRGILAHSINTSDFSTSCYALASSKGEVAHTDCRSKDRKKCKLISIPRKPSPDTISHVDAYSCCHGSVPRQTIIAPILYPDMLHTLRIVRRILLIECFSLPNAATDRYPSMAALCLIAVIRDSIGNPDVFIKPMIDQASVSQLDADYVDGDTRESEASSLVSRSDNSSWRRNGQQADGKAVGGMQGKKITETPRDHPSEV